MFVKKPNCLIIAGERSGEEHALSFLPGLQKNCSETYFWGVGGDEMKSLGVEIVYHLKDFSTWGISEALKKLPFYYNALKDLETRAQNREASVAILVDFQDFNLRLATRLSRKGVKVLYYVAPQAWAWRPWRVKALSAAVETLYVFLPFEKKWFQDRGVKQVESVPHPLMQATTMWREKLKQNMTSLLAAQVKRLKETNSRRILLLPGSRNSEVKRMLPLFIKALDVLKKHFDLSVTVIQAANVNKNLYESFYNKKDIRFLNETDLYSSLLEADVCLSTSGTVTLSCALMRVPTVVCYESGLFNEFIFQSFVQYKGHISLPNLILNSPIYPEILQNQLSVVSLVEKLNPWLQNDTTKFIETRTKLAQVEEILSKQNHDVVESMSSIIGKS
jgi:lipid-A-disaccharide synthase